MAIWDRVLKLEKRFDAIISKVTMLFIENAKDLTKEQLDSESTIYVCMEI